MSDQDQSAPQPSPAWEHVATARLNGVMFMALGLALIGLGLWSLALAAPSVLQMDWAALRERGWMALGVFLFVPYGLGALRFGLRVFRSRGKPIPASLR